MEEVESIEFDGDIYGVVTIILNIEFNEKEDFIETIINSSLGISGYIKSKRVMLSILKSK